MCPKQIENNDTIPCDSLSLVSVVFLNPARILAGMRHLKIGGRCDVFDLDRTANNNDEWGPCQQLSALQGLTECQRFQTTEIPQLCLAAEETGLEYSVSLFVSAPLIP